MALAVIVDTFPRWSERFIARELNELARRGIDFRIYCLRAGDSDCESDPDFAALMPRRVVLPFCFLPGRSPDLGIDADSIQRKEKAAQAIGSGGHRQVACANALAKLLKQERATGIYAHFASLPSTLGWLAARALNVPFRMSAHARDVFVEPQLLSEKIHDAQRIFTCNRRAYEILGKVAQQGESSADGGKIILMPHGLPLEYFPFREPPSPSTPLRLLCAGRMVPKKGFAAAIEALAAPMPRDQRPLLTFVGDGPERKNLERLTRKLGLSSQIAFMGGQSRAEKVLEHFRSSDALLVPSLNTPEGDSEGIPNVILEAFAAGLPVIGTLSGSSAEALNSETGTVISEAAPDAIAAAIREFAEPGARNRVIAAADEARKLIERHHDIRKTIEPLVSELGPPSDLVLKKSR